MCNMTPRMGTTVHGSLLEKGLNIAIIDPRVPVLAAVLRRNIGADGGRGRGTDVLDTSRDKDLRRQVKYWSRKLEGRALRPAFPGKSRHRG